MFKFTGRQRWAIPDGPHCCTTCGKAYAWKGWLRHHYGQFPVHDPGQHHLDQHSVIKSNEQNGHLQCAILLICTSLAHDIGRICPVQICVLLNLPFSHFFLTFLQNQIKLSNTDRLTRTVAVLRPISIPSQVGLCPSLLRLSSLIAVTVAELQQRGGGGGESSNLKTFTKREGREGHQTRWRGRLVCCDCSGLLQFTMPCLFRILSSHCIYPQSGITRRPSKYMTLFLVCFSAAAVGGEGGIRRWRRWRRGRHGRSAMKHRQDTSSGACYL